MGAAEDIRSSLERVAALRAAHAKDRAVSSAVHSIKAVQARRFSATYADLLAGDTYAAPARFFLEELYSDRDYSARDAQFGKIAGAIDTFFPSVVTRTAVDLARLHALTEELDDAMAKAWIDAAGEPSESLRYTAAWRKVGRRSDRDRQLAQVLAIGEEMARLTRAPGLRTMLRMMRSPAAAAGLESLQRFLEAGFDTFAAIARGGRAPAFLGTISQRESAFIAMMFEAADVACGTELEKLLGQAP